MTIFRVYYATRGAHVHCRVFAGEGETLMPCGKLVMRAPEFEAFAHFTKIFPAQFPALAARKPVELPAEFFFIAEQSRGGESTTESIVAEWLSLPTAIRTKERLLEILGNYPFDSLTHIRPTLPEE
jgi:hypothetical protein